MIRRINLFGGPGSGKSTIAAKIFAALKVHGVSVEHVQEYIKAWTYYDRKPNKWDQTYFFAKQQQAEYRYLVNNDKGVIVTDSPILQGISYAPTTSMQETLLELHFEYEQEFPSVNLFICRGDKPFHQEGRWQTLDEAKKIDNKTLDFLNSYGICPYMMDFREISQLNDHDLYDIIRTRLYES